MMMKKLISGLSAFAIAASCMAVGASAADEPVENNFYNATGHWSIKFNGSDMDVVKAVDPAEDWGDSAEVKSAKGQLVGYTNEETGKPDYYNLGFNLQVGHMKKAKITVKVTSDNNNIYLANEDGTSSAGSEDFMYTVQKSWNQDCGADFKQGWTHGFDADGNPVYADGACDLDGWNSGPGKFNGVWAQISLTDDDLSGLHFEVIVDADDRTTWEYHPYNAEKPEEYQYVILNAFGGNGGYKPSSVEGDGDAHATTTVGENEETGETFTNTGVVVDGDYINAQFGGKTKPVEPAYISIKKAKVTFKSNTVAYTGKALKPSVTVKLDGKTLKKDTDYTVAYKNNKKTGKATAVVTGKGGYIDSVSKSFIIVPKKPAKPTVKAGSKKMTVTLKKDKTATGYQISYSLKKNFKSGVKNVNITKNTTVKKTISKLKKGKTYYVKSRSYIKVGSKKYYGAYGAVSSAKIK